MPNRQKLRLVLLLALALTALLLIVFGPMLLGRFSLNVLTRSMIYAMLAITVDLIWGYTGVLTFGQAAFFGVGAYATAMVLTHIGASPALSSSPLSPPCSFRSCLASPSAGCRFITDRHRSMPP